MNPQPCERCKRVVSSSLRRGLCSACRNAGGRHGFSSHHFGMARLKPRGARI